MNRYYEGKLPEGYSEAFVVDANDKKQGMKFQIAAILSVAVLINVFFFVYALPRLNEIAAGFTVLKCAGVVIAYFLYVVLHELTHGLVYKLLTGKKLTFGFKLPSAYCGVPDIYTYRITSLLSLSAPLTVFSILFVFLFLMIRDTFLKAMILLLFALHISGCTGDLYGIFLFLFRFKNPASLRKDFGARQVYYIKD
ncbi:MAG: DUF3267 domain-containing protein [Clostridia bacterium]|nr:DUF3267 domain-containing protein [Clostridia bacterium]